VLRRVPDVSAGGEAISVKKAKKAAKKKGR
jgi:hypothetical protein